MTRTGIGKLPASASALLLSLLILAGACGGPKSSSEEQLRAWMADAEARVEGKERRNLLSMLAPSYSDASGNELQDVDERLKFWFFRQHNIELLVAVDDVRVFDETAAEMDVTVAMAGTDNSTFGFSADAYRFSFELEFVDDRWLLLSADWSKIGE